MTTTNKTDPTAVVRNADARGIEIRRAPVTEFKALGDDAPAGSFEAIVAVFGNIDSHGDRMVKGAFERTLKAPPEGRGFPPQVWSHDWMVPPIGASLEAHEEDRGLYIKGRLLVADDEDHAIARQVWAAMKAKGGDGRPPLREFSFGYRTVKAQWVEEDPDTLPADLQWTGGEIRELLDVDLYEVGPTLVGSNPGTELLGVKTALRQLEQRGAITSDDAAKILEQVSDNPGPTAPAQSAEMSEEVAERIAAVQAYGPPISL